MWKLHGDNPEAYLKIFLKGHLSDIGQVKGQNVVFTRTRPRYTVFGLSWPTLGWNKGRVKPLHEYWVPIRFILYKDQGQDQLTKGHDVQRSQLSSVIHAFWTMFSGRRSWWWYSLFCLKLFLEPKVKVTTRSGHQMSNFEIVRSPQKYVSGSVFLRNPVVSFILLCAP